MSGSQPTSYFQDENYCGPEKRLARVKLSEEAQNIVDVITARMPRGCGDGCKIPPEAIPHLAHATDSVKKIGKGSIERGINSATDQHMKVAGVLDNLATAKKTSLKTLIGFIVGSLLTLIGLGAYQKFKMGM